MDEKKSLNFVTWTEEEDNILRENHRIYGERWSIIASYLKNKTSRQCKRRFSAYLSADNKKGSWSAEEDKLLIEAHEKFGNRWTKIAKIVSGRTDNAVKNRYHVLINKHEKDKENNQPHILSEGNKNAFPDDKESQTVFRDSDCKRARLTPAEEVLGTAQSEENQSTLNPRKVLGALPQNNLNEARLMSSNHYSTLYNPFISAIESSSPVSKEPPSFTKTGDAKVSALSHLKTLAQNHIAQLSTAQAIDFNKESIRNMEALYIPAMNNRNNEMNRCLSLERLHPPSLPKLCEPCEDISQRSSTARESSNSSLNLSKIFNESAFPIQNPKMGQAFQTSLSVCDGNQHVSPIREDGRSCTASAQGLFNQSERSQSCLPKSPFQEYGSPVHLYPVFQDAAGEVLSPRFSDSEKQFLLNLISPSSRASEGYSLSQRKGSPVCRISFSTRF